MVDADGGGTTGGLLQWVSEVGSSEWCWLAVMGVTVVGGCDSRCRHRVLLESVPGLTQPPIFLISECE